MKDVQNNFQDHLEDENSNSDINTIQEGMEQEHESNENRKEGKTSCEQILKKNGKDMETQEKDPAEEGQADASVAETLEEAGQKAEAKRKADHETVQEDQVCKEAEEAVLNQDLQKEAAASVPQTEESSSPQYSCSYTPPYYVPNFTVTSPGVSSNPSQKEKKSFGMGVVALVVVIALVVSVMGGFAGYFGGKLLDDYSGLENIAGNTAGGNGDSMTVIKNDGSIKVNEEIGATGYSGLTYSEVAALVADSVVEITTTQATSVGNYVTSGAGSGVIIDKEGKGYIITNYHVIEGADGITVRLTDGTEYTATCLGGDEDYDIAVLKINAEGLSFATMGSSKNLRVGEEVVAIGNPLGELGGTVTNGIISALDRNVIVDGNRMTLLQTNTAINPGNSGGGLFDMSGNLIGIVNAKQSETGIEGLGFAIPIDIAWAAAKDIIEYGYVVGKLVLSFDATMYSQPFSVNGAYGYMPAGVYITKSENSQLAIYDRIVSMNGVAIEGLSDYYRVIDSLQKGDTLTMVVSRLASSSFFGNSFQEYTVNVGVSVTEKP